MTACPDTSVAYVRRVQTLPAAPQVTGRACTLAAGVTAEGGGRPATGFPKPGAAQSSLSDRVRGTEFTGAGR